MVINKFFIDNEIWKNIKDFPGYQISTFGRVRSFKSGEEKFLYKKIEPNGYVRVCLFNNGKRKYLMVHRLVCINFMKNPENKPNVNHIDNNTLNNRLDNLEWCTQSENIIHSIKQGRFNNPKGEKCSWTKITDKQVKEIRDLENNGVKTRKQLAEIYNVSLTTIQKISTNNYSR